MPGILLKISGEPDPALTPRVVHEIMALTCRVLDKQPERTMVMVDYVPRENWFIAGRSLVEHEANSFRLEVTITDETNTRAQKAEFHRAAFALLCELIGNVHPHSNIHVIDCRASAYGYGGVTQEYRSHHDGATA